jgi:succinate dehydrogenase hydrophobic anchor subunit
MNAFLWMLQRASGLLLVALVGVHMGVQYGAVPSPFRRPVLLGIDWVLLALVLFHGINGLRTIAYDHIVQRRTQRAVGAALWLAGLALFAYGGWGLAMLSR